MDSQADRDMDRMSFDLVTTTSIGLLLGPRKIYVPSFESLGASYYVFSYRQTVRPTEIWTGCPLIL
ncbi:hypothetical protein J6590_074574 [Homalodisca vitripennis]|nr:hypothetical protein J6590_074574 [Homalodisca vitripennis]